MYWISKEKSKEIKSKSKIKEEDDITI